MRYNQKKSLSNKLKLGKNIKRNNIILIIRNVIILPLNPFAFIISPMILNDLKLIELLI